MNIYKSVILGILILVSVGCSDFVGFEDLPLNTDLSSDALARCEEPSGSFSINNYQTCLSSDAQMSTCASSDVIVQTLPNKVEYIIQEKGKKDSANDIKCALDLARTDLKDSVIKFENADYYISPYQTNSYHIDIIGQNSLTSKESLSFEGTGSTRFLFKNPTVGGINIQKMNSIELKNITLDYETLPFTQGEIKNISITNDNVNYIDLEIDQGYPLPSPIFQQANQLNGFRADLNGNLALAVLRPDTDRNSFYSRNNDGSYRIYFKNRSYRSLNTTYEKGNKFVLLARTYLANMLDIRANHTVLIQNITIHSSPGTASTLGFNTGDIIFDNYKIIQPKLATETNKTRKIKRLLSSNADGIHAFGNRGRVLVKNSHFEGMGDDAINLHTRSPDGALKVEDNIIYLRDMGTVNYIKNDVIQIYDKKTSQTWDVTLSSDGEYVRDSNLCGGLSSCIKLTLQPPNGYNIGYKSVALNDLLFFNKNMDNSGSIIEYNYFGRFRGAATVIRAEDIMIRNNIADLTYGIFAIISPDVDVYFEGPVPANITITWNKIRHTPDYISTYAPPAIIAKNRYTTVNTAKKPIEHLEISHNTFTGIKSLAMQLQDVRDLNILGNFVDGSQQLNRVTPGPAISLSNISSGRMVGIAINDRNSNTLCLVKQDDQSKIIFDIDPKYVIIPAVDSKLFCN